MTKQLTPAEELRVLDKAATILSRMMAKGHGDCPEPEQFNPSGKCGKCFREWAINRAIKGMEASK